MTNPLQVLEKALKEINPNCDAWYSSDTYISWADLMKAIRMCLDTDDDTPEPKPEPLSASEALERAQENAEVDSPESAILWAAYQYANSNPEWFRDWHKCDDPSDALESAQHFAYDDDMVAWHVLSAARRIAADNPALFDGDDEPEPITVTTDKEAAEPIEYATVEYAQGYDAGYAEGYDDGLEKGHAEGYRDAVDRFAGGGEA